MRTNSLICVIFFTICLAACADEPLFVTHWQFQAVHADGSSLFDDSARNKGVRYIY